MDFPAGNAPAGKDREAQEPRASWRVGGVEKRMRGGEGCFGKGKVARMRSYSLCARYVLGVLSGFSLLIPSAPLEVGRRQKPILLVGF